LIFSILTKGALLDTDGCNPAEDIALLDMLEHSLQRADKNHPYREKRIADHFDSILKVGFVYWICNFGMCSC
jgi:hypothetical protein